MFLFDSIIIFDYINNIQQILDKIHMLCIQMNMSQTRFGPFLLLEAQREICGMARTALTLCPFSCPHSQQPGSNEADSHWNSHSVPLQQITGSGDGEGGKGCAYSDELLASCHLSFLSLNVCSLCALFLFAVLSPGGVGKHDSLDGLLCLLLCHLAHPPHRPRHAGPGKSNISLTGRQWG